eukprot:4841654-Pyramimonas_sp.AAC.1
MVRARFLMAMALEKSAAAMSWSQTPSAISSRPTRLTRSSDNKSCGTLGFLPNTSWFGENPPL